jgi:hypothetical protein
VTTGTGSNWRTFKFARLKLPGPARPGLAGLGELELMMDFVQ